MDLLDLRNQLDVIDANIVDLYEKRMDICRQVAEYKISTGKKVFDKQRETEKLAAVRAMTHNEFNAHGIQELFEQIMSMSRKLQYQLLAEQGSLGKLPFIGVDALETKKARVVFQGAEGAYSQAAMMQYFKDDISSFHVDTFRDAMSAIDEGSADFAVLPIENSSAGSVSAVYDLLIQNRFVIAKAVTVKVSHCLAALCPVEDVTEVVSHPQALAQCNQYITSHQYVRREYSNTATAGKFISETAPPHTAAICSEQAAQKYGLHILDRDIQDAKFNRTRFIAISRTLYTPEDANKISICFDIPHVAGSLHSVLERFALHNLNMTKIESRPVPNEPFRYHFYLDFTGCIHDPDTLQLIASLAEELPNFTFFGNYVEE